MSIYYGIVKDNQIILPADTQLAEGATVEVRILQQSDQQSPTEADFQQQLVDLGLLEHPKIASPTAPLQNQPPIKVEGQPLSQTIIAERR